MGRNSVLKKKKRDWGESVISNCHPAFVNPESGFIWCYYCDREWHPMRLKSHQEESHFACPTGCRSKPRHRNIGMLIEHYRQEHKRPLQKVPNAIVGRRDPKIDVALTTGVPPEAIQDRENARNTAKQQEIQYLRGCDEFSFENNEQNLGDGKQVLKFEVDKSWTVRKHNKLINSTDDRIPQHILPILSTTESSFSTNTTIEDRGSNTKFEEETTTIITTPHIEEPKAFCFRHGLDGMSVEERRANLSQYQATAEWATKVVDALEILQLLKKSVQNNRLPTLDDVEEEVRFEDDGVALKYSSLTAWYSSSKKAFYTIHTLAFFLLHDFQLSKPSALKYLSAAKKANAQTVSSVDRQQIRQYLLGETVSVPKGGDLPRPSVVNIIGGSSVKSEVPPPSEYHEQQYPISSKEVIAITPKANRYEEESYGTTTTALQPNNPNNPSSSLKKTTYPVVLKRKNEQQGSNGSDVVESLLSPHFKRERSLEMDNDDMDFDLEDVVEEPQEKRVKGVAAVTKTTSTVSSIDQHTCHEKEGGEDKTSTLHGCKRQRIVYPEVERETVTDSFSLNDDEMVLEFSSSSPHLKDSASCANIKRNVEDEVNESTLSCHNTSTTGKRVVAAASLEGSSSSSPEKRPKQQLRASDYTLKMIVDVLFEIECEAQENPGIRRYTAACKCVSKRHGLDDATVTSWWSAKDMIIQQSSTMGTMSSTPPPGNLSIQPPSTPPHVGHTLQSQIIMTKKDLENNFGLCSTRNNDTTASSCVEELLLSSNPSIQEREIPLPLPLIKESCPPKPVMDGEQGATLQTDDVMATMYNSPSGNTMLSPSSSSKQDEATSSPTLPVVIKEQDLPLITLIEELKNQEEPPIVTAVDADADTKSETTTTDNTNYDVMTGRSERNEDDCSDSDHSSTYTSEERNRWLNHWDQARTMQKGSTTKGFAEAYGIPLELFQSWLSERKYDKRNKKRKVERRKNVDPLHKNDCSLSFLLNALNEENSKSVNQLIYTKLWNGETVSVIRAFQVANCVCPKFLGDYNPPKGCISNLKKSHWFYQLAKRWYKAFKEKCVDPANKCCSGIGECSSTSKDSVISGQSEGTLRNIIDDASEVPDEP